MDNLWITIDDTDNTRYIEDELFLSVSMCRICGGKKVVYGLGYMPTDCVCAKPDIPAIVKAELAEIVDKPQKLRKKRANDEQRSDDING